MQFEKPYSDAMAQIVDEEAKAVVSAAYERTRDLLNEKKEYVEALAELLLEKETINQDDIVRVLGERPFKMSDTYEEILNASWKPKSSTSEEDVENNSEDVGEQEDTSSEKAGEPLG